LTCMMQVESRYSVCMRHTSLADMPCPVARTLDVIGEWWTLLVVRDALLGARRFDEFKATGIADNILSARLKRLVEEGLFERRLYQSRPHRYEYVLTEKGRALAVVVSALRSWGQEWTQGKDLSRLSHRDCGHEVSISMYCEECGRPLSVAEIQPARAGAGARESDRVAGQP
jgi:DNA-binding HxlR family transcriptional regulator